MEINTIKRAAKLSEWGERIRACRSSGIPVRTWCAENNINVKNYYRWERLYIAQATAHTEMDTAQCTTELVRIEPVRLPEAVLVPDVQKTNEKLDSTPLRMILRYGNTELELPYDAPTDRIAELLHVLKAI